MKEALEALESELILMNEISLLLSPHKVLEMFCYLDVLKFFMYYIVNKHILVSLQRLDCVFLFDICYFGCYFLFQRPNSYL